MKSIKKYAAALIVMAAAIGMMGCKISVDEHIFSEVWESNAESHWHKATCEHTEEVSDRAPHSWDNKDYQYDSESGKDKRTCTVCGYVDEKGHVHGSATTWTKTATTHRKTYECCGAAKTAEAPHEWDHEDFQYDSESKMEIRTCTVCSYVDEGFVLVDGGTVTGAACTDNYTGVFPAGRNVKISSFCMGKYEVTQAQYKAVMAGQKVVTASGIEYALKDSPSSCTGSNSNYKIDWEKDHSKYPVENVTWYDAVYYCNALSEKEKLDPCYTITVTKVSEGHITAATVEYDSARNGYRLPTEAEWEYAARGGDPEQAYWNYTFSGADKAKDTSYSSKSNTGLDSVGWYCYNNITGETGDSDVTDSAEGKGTHEVGKKKANRLGIHDMSGNVWEWCWDWLISDLETGDVTDPVGAASGSNRIYRGGSWVNFASSASVGVRRGGRPDYSDNNLGFRVCRSSSK